MPFLAPKLEAIKPLSPRFGAANKAVKAARQGRGNAYGAAFRPTDIDDIAADTAPVLIAPIDYAPGQSQSENETYTEALSETIAPAFGGEILWSGNEPVHPQDCSKWPDSPFCGGSFLDPAGSGKSGLLPVALTVSVTTSDTEVIIQIDPSLFFINLPPVWLGWRRDGVFPVRGSTSRQVGPTQVQTWGSPDEDPREWIVIKGGAFKSANIPEADWQHYSSQYPLWAGPWPNDPENLDVIRVTGPELRLQGRLTARGGIWSRTFWERGVDLIRNVFGSLVPEDGTERDPIDAALENEYVFTSVIRLAKAKAVRVTQQAVRDEFPYYDRYDVDAIPGYFERPYNPQANGRNSTKVEAYVFNPFNQTWMWWQQNIYADLGMVIPGVIVFPWEPSPRLPPPPPPSLPPRSPALQPEDPMACDCKKIEELLKKILALLDHEGTRELDLTPCETDPDAPSGNRKYTWQGKGLKGVFDALEKLTDGATETYQVSKCVAPALGVKKLPWDLPGNMGDGEGSETVDNYAELQIYILKQLSQMLGQTKIKIKVKDSDLVAEGNQTKELEFENVSEAMAELLGLALTNQSIASAGLNASLTGVIQSGMAFTTAAVIDKHIEEIVEFLGFSQKRSAFQVPLPYTPGGTTPEEILKDTVVNLRYYENVDRRTFQSHAVIVEQAAAIIRAAFYERIGSEFTGVSDVKEKITTAAEQAFGDFDTFLEDVEQGFTGAPGATDITPYGRAYGERPRIRKIGGSSANDGTNP